MFAFLSAIERNLMLSKMAAVVDHDIYASTKKRQCRGKHFWVGLVADDGWRI
jgi:hypothetical protein